MEPGDAAAASDDAAAVDVGDLVVGAADVVVVVVSVVAVAAVRVCVCVVCCMCQR